MWKAACFPAAQFGSLNAGFIMLLAIPFAALWTWLAKKNLEPNTPVKFGLGILQAGLGFGALVFGAQFPNDAGQVAMIWLVLAYLLHTTGELCLSPVGLSMVTKLSPKRLVSTTMGAWFLATAFSSFLAAIIATFTGVGHGGGGGDGIPVPLETVNVYGDVFYVIGLASIASALLLLLGSPILKMWMHGVDDARAPAH